MIDAFQVVVLLQGDGVETELAAGFGEGRGKASGDPVISVDAKKKELVGQYKKAGRTWRPKGQPEQVNVHDFTGKELGKVTPYGVYDMAANSGWVNVGTDHDTAQFAVSTIRTWWDKAGRQACPGATRLLITADGGGSNGYRTRLWKTELARFAGETGLPVTVCHLPPGTSKWNKVEHRLFSHISMAWRGRPLTSHEVIVETIAATTTRTGLSVTAELDTSDYPKGIKISDRQMRELEKSGALQRHAFHGEWNYTLIPGSQLRVLFFNGRLVPRPPTFARFLPRLMWLLAGAGAVDLSRRGPAWPGRGQSSGLLRSDQSVSNALCTRYRSSLVTSGPRRPRPRNRWAFRVSSPCSRCRRTRTRRGTTAS